MLACSAGDRRQMILRGVERGCGRGRIWSVSQLCLYDIFVDMKPRSKSTAEIVKGNTQNTQVASTGSQTLNPPRTSPKVFTSTSTTYYQSHSRTSSMTTSTKILDLSTWAKPGNMSPSLKNWWPTPSTKTTRSTTTHLSTLKKPPMQHTWWEPSKYLTNHLGHSAGS